MKYIFTLALAFSSSLIVAQNCNCCSENYRQFDFWLGDWNVYDPAGTLVGTNTIHLVSDSCAIQEHWTSSQGNHGTSLSFYDNGTEKWNQLWIGGQGGPLSISGQPEEGKMIMFTERLYSKQKQAWYIDRITWTNNDDGSVRQHWERSFDEKKSWKTLFDGLYKRK